MMANDKTAEQRSSSCSYEVLAELGIRDPVDIADQTAKELEKRAVVRELGDLLAMPAVREWAANRGVVLGDFWGKKPLSRVVEEGKFQDELLTALRGAAEADRPSWESLLEGLATLSGVEMTPSMRAQSATLSGDVAKVAPYIQMIAPELWDRMHGQAGSVGALTRSIAEANRLRPSTPGGRQTAC